MATNVLKQRTRLVHDFKTGHWSMSELCERFGVTRRPGTNGSRVIAPVATRR